MCPQSNDFDRKYDGLNDYNPGNHWILIAIELIDWTVVYIDPLWGAIRKEFKYWMDK